MTERSSLTTILRAQSRVKISLRELRMYWIDSRPEQVNAPDRDARLLDALRELALAGVIKLPSEASFEDVGNPRMPRFVTVSRSTPGASVRDWSSVPWHPSLGFWPSLPEKDKAVAEKINAWILAAEPMAPYVPLRERSLEILGDEKALDTRVRSQALFAGRLPLTAIRALVVPHPLPYRRTDAAGAPLLVVENHHTYWSFAEWNERSHAFAAIVYGSGRTLGASGDALSRAMLECGAISAEYFGDIDPAGVAIPLQFMNTTGVRLEPAMRFYQAALSSARRCPGVNRLPRDLELLEEWLPTLIGPIRGLWDAGERIPQESVGTEFLLALKS